MIDSSTVTAAYHRASEHWSVFSDASAPPGGAIDLDADSFARYIAGLDIDAQRLDQRSSDLFLAAALSNGDRSAEKIFEADVIARARAAVRRYGDDDFCSEVLQKVRVHLLVPDGDEPARIRRYDGRASLRSWVGVCAVRMALYILRGERNQRTIGQQWSTAITELPTGDPTLDELKQRYSRAFRDALQSASERLSKRQRAVLRLRFAHGASVDDIASTYAVHRVTAWRWLSGARDALLEHALAALKTALPDDDTTLRSLATLVKSRIELSVFGLFADDSEPD